MWQSTGSSPPPLGRGVIYAEGGGLNVAKPSGREFFASIVRHGDNAKAVILGAVPLENDERADTLKSLGVREVEALVIDEAAADLPDTYARIADASIVFIRGGDQGRYVRWWRGKRTEAALRAVFERGGVIGGTSAGCAVLGEFTYSAENNSLSAQEALANPYHEDLTLVRGFLGFVPGVLFDTHFTERGRIGRLPVLLARCRELGGTPLALGLDPRTAAIVHPDGSAEIIGENTATLLQLVPDSRIEVRPQHPPTVTDVRCAILLPGTRLALPSGSVTSRPDDVKPGNHDDLVEETAFEPLTLDGAMPEHGALGVLQVAANGQEGSLSVKTGEGRLPASIVLPNAFGRDIWERLSTCLRALASEPALIAWLLTPGCRIDVDEQGQARVAPNSTAAAVIIDAHGVKHSGTPPSADFAHPAAHIESTTLHVLGPGWAFDVRRRRAVQPV
jgi:cyanophycinase